MQVTPQKFHPTTLTNHLPAAVHINGVATTASAFQAIKDATDTPTAIMGKMNTIVAVCSPKRYQVHGP